MKIIKYRDGSGKLRLRCGDDQSKEAKVLFKHCAGGASAPSSMYREIVDLLLMHSVVCVSLEEDKSVRNRKK